MQNNWRKKYSFSLATMLLLSTFAQTAAPIAAYAETEVDSSDAAVLDIEQSVITVSEALSRGNDASTANVKGYIVAHVAGNGPSLRFDEFANDHNFALADNPDETDPENMILVQIPSSFRGEFGLQSKPNNIGREVIATGQLKAYFGEVGLRELSELTFVEADAGEDPPSEEPQELELLSILEAREQQTGEVKTKGVVTARLRNTIQIQDGTAAIAVRPTSLNVEVGDTVTVTGTLQDYRGLLQLDSAVLDEKVSGAEVPSPISLTGDQLSRHQSQLAVLSGVEITDVQTGSGWANYTATDSSGAVFTVRDENGTLDLQSGRVYESITGIVSQFDDTQQIIPRNSLDIIEDSSIVQPVIASPGSGSVPIGTSVLLDTPTSDTEIFYTVDGSDPDTSSLRYSDPILITEQTTIRSIAVRGEQTSTISEFAYNVFDAEEGMRIHDIQGAGHFSPMNGEKVFNVKGVVTYVYSIQGGNYFHMQTPDDLVDDDPNTSEGIVVYTGRSTGVEVGNLVEVTGNVSEYFIDGYSDKEDTDLPVTQINARDDRGGIVNVLENVVDLPEPIQISSDMIPSEIKGDTDLDVFDPDLYSLDFWESVEGMYVEVMPSVAIAPQQHGDLVVVTEDYEPENRTVNGGIRLSEEGPDSKSIQFKLQPNGPARELAVKTGDRFTESIEGVVNYGFGNYKVYADLDDVRGALVEAERADVQTSIIKDEDKLTVATYNVENFSANRSQTSDVKAQRIARSFVEQMESPDIIGIVEVMANNGTSSTSPEADQSYERLISEIENAGGPSYDYANIDPVFNADGGAPGGNIRVGYLYNPERVSLIEGAIGGTSDAVGYVDGSLTLNPGRVSPSEFTNTRKPLAAQFEFNGDSVVVINNHLNSKLGDDPYYGQNQPPRFGSRAQRNQLAETLNSFVGDILEDNPEENIVVLGDMNDYEFSEPLQILAGDELTNLIHSVPEMERYNYVYQGSSQVLDHILVSNNLVESAEIDILNINADYTDMHSRASDHDPVLAQIDLRSSEDSEEDAFTLSLMHTNDTHARVENYPKLITAIDQYREENPNALHVNAGDVFSGTLYFNEFRGQADVALMNLMGIDVMTFGNHEFDLGDSEDGHRSLSEFVKKANFPFLGTNVDFSNDPYMSSLETNTMLERNPEAGLVYDSIIFEVEGEEIGVFGLVTEDTKNIASPADVEFEDFIQAAEEAVQAFEDAGINKIMAVNHLGFDSAPEVGNDLRLAGEVAGIDIIVGGHSHTELMEPVVIETDADGNPKAPTVIVQGGEYAEFLGTLNVDFNDQGEIIRQSGALIDATGLEDDPDAVELLQEYKDRIEEVSNQPIGAEAMKDLPNPRLGGESDVSVRANETELGNLITDAMLNKAQEKFPETVIAFQNG
ncbi:DUF6359 domain-containing protein, partial [Alkalibacterium pelagium]